MKQADQASRGISSVSYTLAEDGLHEIGWSWRGDSRQFGLASRDLKRLLQAVIIAVSEYQSAKIQIYQRALHSIEKATCCGTCNEAAREAFAALRDAAGIQGGAPDRLSA